MPDSIRVTFYGFCVSPEFLAQAHRHGIL